MSAFLLKKRVKRHFIRLMLPLLCGTLCSLNGAAQSVTLYTPYTQISVPPGESISYDIDVINRGKSVINAPVAISGLPRGWSYTLKSGGWSIDRVAVLPNDRKTISLQVQVPLQVNKGTYHFAVAAGTMGRLPLAVTVSRRGTYKSEFTAQQPNMQGAANTTFTYTATLRNGTAADQTYALNAVVPGGWTANFKADYKQVASVTIEANKSKDITIEVDPPDQTPAGDYKIPVHALSNGATADLQLEMVVTGSYAMQLTTPTGLLSAKTTAGEEKRVELSVRNTGTAMLKNITMQGTAPANWEVTFEPQHVAGIAPGNSVQVYATIKPDKKAIAGDYVTSMEAHTDETSGKADFRVTVETSVWSGWFGLLIILMALGSVYYLFRTYGRR